MNPLQVESRTLVQGEKHQIKFQHGRLGAGASPKRHEELFTDGEKARFQE
jgi:hypothetical protein